MIVEFSRQSLEKYSNFIFHYNLPSGSLVVPYGRTDGRTDEPDSVNVRFFAILRTSAKSRTLRVSAWALR
jgi:hypothetical protein